MDREAAVILADSIKELKDAFMFAAIAYQKHTVFQQEQVLAEIKRLEDVLDGTEVKNNDQDNDGN